jgi:hypothetical protein
MQLTATLFSSDMADVNLSVNHARITTPAGKAVPERPQIFQSPFVLSLRTGWNELTARGTCVGYPPLRTGLVLEGPAENLWKLRLSSTAGGPNQ